MHPDQIFVIVVASLITGCITLGLFAQAWGEAMKRKATSGESHRLDAIETRLARMEGALEAVAIEMERVAEGQRFTARLLAERGSTEAGAPVARSVQQSDLRRVTPH